MPFIIENVYKSSETRVLVVVISWINDRWEQKKKITNDQFFCIEMSIYEKIIKCKNSGTVYLLTEINLLSLTFKLTFEYCLVNRCY